MFAVTLAIYAIEFIAGGKEEEQRLTMLGAGLSSAAILLFFTTATFVDNSGPMCDRYSTPYALALVLAAGTFVVAPLTLARQHSRVFRFAALATCGAGSLGLVAWLFPECLKGPYGGLPDYLRDTWLAYMIQEKSIFAQPDQRVSGMAPNVLLLFTSIGAVVAAASLVRFRFRHLNVYSFYAVVMLVHTILIFRYLRYVSLFAGPGLAFLLAAIPVDRLSLFVGKPRVAMRSLPALCAPGLMLLVVVLGVRAISPDLTEMRFAGADIAAMCEPDDLANLTWPANARVFSPPLLSIDLLKAHNVTVTVVPLHTGVPGVERAQRFFDPATPDPRVWFDRSRATHVMVCRYPGEPNPRLQENFPLAVDLMSGRSPNWLHECDIGVDSTVRVYTTGEPCPATEAAGSMAGALQIGSTDP